MTKRTKDLLEKANLKQTKQRHLILEILTLSEDFMSADDIFVKAKEQDVSMSLSTVYRVLETFTEHRIVTAMTLEHEKQVLYEITHAKHAHHLICLGCRKVIHIEGCPIEDYENTLAKRHDFDIADHTLNFYGYCQACGDKLE